MFSVALSSITGFRNSIIQAKIKNLSAFEESTGDGWDFAALKRFSGLITEKFEFKSKLPVPDNFWTGSRFDLYSEPLIEEIQNHGVNCELFDSVLFDSKWNISNRRTHKVFHLL